MVNRLLTQQKAKQDLEILSYNLLSTANVDSKGLAIFSAATSPLDPNKPVHEQIDLLRYDCRWEFPLEAVDFGPVLGQGAFGKVYKATAYGLKTHCSKAYSIIAHVPKEDTSALSSTGSNTVGVEVAVKMLKHYATMEQLKSLLSELKILTYVGAHVNTVNLLGACTSNLVKGELYVLMEYCCYGNLQQYLFKHRHCFEEAAEVAAEEASGSLTKKQETAGKHDGEETTIVDQKGSGFCTQKSNANLFLIISDHFKHRLAKLLSRRHLFEHHHPHHHHHHHPSSGSGDVQFSKHNGDEEEETNVQLKSFDSSQPLTVQDLINFAYQCASGMQYLASKKVSVLKTLKRFYRIGLKIVDPSRLGRPKRPSCTQ